MDTISLHMPWTGLTVGLGCVAICFSSERLRPVQRQNLLSLRFNLLYFLPASLLQSVLTPIASVLTIATVNAGGGGLFDLPDSGWRLFPAFFIYLLAMDCGEYIFHRAQHRSAFLWSMHALHHSDVEINASTTIRHYWIEPFIKSLTIYLAVALIFRVGERTLTLYAITTCYNYFSHMNFRLGFGRWSFLINGPQYHRIHHSALPEHRNTNFAGLLPIFDVVFGTYRQPARDEFPPTGLTSHEVPTAPLQALVWPFRGLWSGIRGTRPHADLRRVA